MRRSTRNLLAGLFLLGSTGISAAALQQAATPARQRYTFVVFTRPVAGKEAEYNRWFDQTHLRDVMRLPGFISGQRFVLAPEASSTGLNSYMAIYEVETDNVAATQRALRAAAGTPSMRVSDSLDRSNVQSGFYRPVGPHLSRSN